MSSRLNPVLFIAVVLFGGYCRATSAEQVQGPQVGDALGLWVEEPGWTMSRAVVQEDGTVILLSNKVFTAVGKTWEDFRREVHDYYVPKFFKNVNVLNTDPPFYIVRGEVGSSGARILFRPTTVLEAVKLSGGFTDRASIKKVQVTRTHFPGNKTYNAYTTTHIINCEKAKQNSAADMQVRAGDEIFVPRQRHWFFFGK